MISGSHSIPITFNSGNFSRSPRVCPPPFKVASITFAPGLMFRYSITSFSITGLCNSANGKWQMANGLNYNYLLLAICSWLDYSQLPQFFGYTIRILLKVRLIIIPAFFIPYFQTIEKSCHNNRFIQLGIFFQNIRY